MNAKHKVLNTGIFAVVLAALFGERDNPFAYTVLGVGVLLILAAMASGKAGSND
jgi:hypothetical protein